MRHGEIEYADRQDGEMRADEMHADEMRTGDMRGNTWRVPNDARRGRTMDTATRKLALIALGLGVVAVLGVGLWSAAGHRNAVVPVIQADSRPIRVKPENPGGLQVSGSNDEFLSGDAGSASSRMAPPAETPEPKLLRASQQEPPATQTASLTNPVPAVLAPAVAALPEKRAALTPSQPPASGPAGAAKTTLVQFAALGSEDAARAQWAQLNRRIPDLLGGHQPSISKTERDGKVYWRVRTGGFADMAQATSFCERARAKGTACSIASF